MEDLCSLLERGCGLSKGVALELVSICTGIGVSTLQRHPRFSLRIAGSEWLLDFMANMSIAQIEIRLREVDQAARFLFYFTALSANWGWLSGRVA